MKKSVEVFGWYGVCAILAAYILVSFSVISSVSFQYQLLNLTGALGIVAESYSKKDYQPVVINVVWLLVALVAIVNILR